PAGAGDVRAVSRRRETIRRAEVFSRTLRLREAYAIAYQEVDRAELLFVRIETERGLHGWGSAAPDADVTGETGAQAETALRAMAEELEDGDASRLALWNDRFERAYPDRPSARAAVS